MVEYCIVHLCLSFMVATDINFFNYERRFCSNLGMNNQAVKAAQEAVQKSEEFDIR